MASLKPAASSDRSGPLEEEALDRLASARRQKINFELDMREAYFFSAPNRQRQILSTTNPTVVRPRDESILNTSFAFEMVGDFATVIVNTFLPESEPWALRRAGPNVDPGKAQQINDQAGDLDKKIFEAIGASNFYSACGVGFRPDLAIGAVGMWIDQRRGHDPICCQPVPLRELEIDVGPEGDIDDRWVVRWARRRHLKSILPGINIPAHLTESKKGSVDDDKIDVRWGFWRLWDREDDCWWQAVVMVGDEIVRHATLKGSGSCPLIIGRFNPSPEWAFAEGPMLQSLPAFRELDGLVEFKRKNLELGILPPIAYPNDSISNLSEGIEPGCAYPVTPGTENAIKHIYDSTPPDPSIYAQQDLEQRIKRLFFLDWPEQRGDTPPTATQWLDQMTMAQRRIGTPGSVFWREFCAPVFQRFQYLLEKSGAIQKLKVDGKVVALAPYNPAQRAADQQDIAQFARFVQLAGSAYPEEFKLQSDGTASIVALAKMMAVTKLWKQRPADQIATAMKQLQGLQAGTPASAPAVPNDAGGAPTPQPMAGPDMAQPQFQFRGNSK